MEANELRSLKDIKGTFTRDLRAWFKGASVHRIRKADVKEMLAHVVSRSHSAANKAHILRWNLGVRRTERLAELADMAEYRLDP